METRLIIHPWRLRHVAHPAVKPSAVPTGQRTSGRPQPTTMLSGLHQRSAGPGKPAGREKKSGFLLSQSKSVSTIKASKDAFRGHVKQGVEL